MRLIYEKTCYCHMCKKEFHYLGIARHRAMHRDRMEDCEITYTDGDTYLHGYSNRKDAKHLSEGRKLKWDTETHKE